MAEFQALDGSGSPIKFAALGTGATGDGFRPGRSVADGDDAAFGAKADSAATSDTGTFSFVSLFKRLLQRFKLVDYDTSAGTDNVAGVGLLLPSASGAVAGGTTTNPLRTDPTGTTTQPVSVINQPTTSRSASTADAVTATANTAAAITYAAAGAGVSHVLSMIAWGFDGTPTGATLKVEDGSGNIIFRVPVTQSGPGFIHFAGNRKGTANTALIITLSAGGSGVTGYINATHWTE